MTSFESFSGSDSCAADYQALTAAGGYVELADWSTVTMTGEDRQAFLHNMCTNDIRGLSPGEGCEAFCTDVKGKIVAHVYILARETQLELLTVPGQAETLIAHLDRYIIREDVQLLDRTSETCWLLIVGARANRVLAELGIPAQLENPWQHTLLPVEAAECLIARCDLLGSDGFLLGCACQTISQVEARLQSNGAQRCSVAAWNALRIESGLPLFGADYSSAQLPQEIDRDQRAISFNKGCYLGQETIARIDALGHVNQKVVLLQFADTALLEADVRQGLELSVDGKSVGQVTSGCWSPHFKAPLALALVRRGSNLLGSKLASAVGAATVIAPVANAS